MRSLHGRILCLVADQSERVFETRRIQDRGRRIGSDPSDGGCPERVLGNGSEAASAVTIAPSNWNARWLPKTG
jgi:hypothetical protein